MNLFKHLACAFAFSFGGMQMHLFAQSPNNVIDEVIWVVGDEAILRSDVESARMEFGANISGNPYCVIPEQLAIQKLFLHQAQLDSIEVESSEITANMDARINELVMRAGSKEKLEEYYHRTMTEIREMMFESLKEQFTVQRVRESLTADVKVTPAEVRRYFKDVPQDSLPWIPDQVEVQIITQQPRIPQEEIERVKEELRDYTERINSGESSFSTLAILYSEDPGTARYGGEMPAYGRAELDPAFANVAFSLTDPTKISKVVESEYGFHIIQLIDKLGDKVKVRHILRLASLSKLITATAVMKLYEQGKLTLDSRVFGPQGILNDSLFLRYTDKRIPDVTIEQLLRHKGGFTVRAGDPMFDWQLVQRVLKRQPPYTIDDYVEYAVRSGLGFRPGTRTYYSNLGYVVLSKVIEKLTGQPYETYVQDSILAPAGCYDMHIGHSRHAEKFPNEVRYYETKEAEKFPACDGSGQMTAKSDGGNDIQGLSGAGGWVASPTEILLFVAAIDGSDTRPDILQPATIRLMTQKTDGSLPLGWMSTEKDGTWSRTGTMSGTNALLRKQSNGYTWVFVTNTSSWKGSRFHRYISTMLRNAFGKVSEWPERDLFIADSLQNDASAGDTTDLSQTTSIP